MSYELLRQIADSWGLVMMGVLFTAFIGWTFRKGAADRHDEAAHMIFGDDDHD